MHVESIHSLTHPQQSKHDLRLMQQSTSKHDLRLVQQSTSKQDLGLTLGPRRHRYTHRFWNHVGPSACHLGAMLVDFGAALALRMAILEPQVLVVVVLLWFDVRPLENSSGVVRLSE